MSKSNAWETGVLALVLNNTTFAGVGDDGLRGSTNAGSLYLALHTSAPAEDGDQTSNEIAYENYARVTISRTGQWTVTGDSAVNANEVSWPTAGATGGATATHWSIGTSASGAGTMLYYGSFSAPVGGLVVGNGVTPRAAAGQLTITEG